MSKVVSIIIKIDITVPDNDAKSIQISIEDIKKEIKPTIRLEDTDMSRRLYHCLKSAYNQLYLEEKGFKVFDTLNDVERFVHEYGHLILLRIRNFGKKTLVELEEIFHEHGFSFHKDKK